MNEKWLIGNLFALISAIFGFGWWAADLSTSVDHALEEMEKNNLGQVMLRNQVTTALTVLADHGTEFADVRAHINRITGQLDSLSNTLEKRTDDRFRRSDYENEIEKLLEFIDLKYQQRDKI
ncbi:MAG: hypothetical protein GY703_09545 [Gammaproteobacteria bacterium]|nr:hypothetical protein [Gammaproteobacteria bacterium]